MPHKLSDSAAELSDSAAASILAAAELYYQDQLSQQQIADRLGVSRSTVSRMLQVARDQGIVQIEIRRPSPALQLSHELETALGLRRAVVVPSAPRGELQVLVAPALAELAALALGAGDVLAVSWGATIWQLAQSSGFPPLRGVLLVPAIAGLDEVDVRFQTNEIARRIAAASGADVSFLHSPALPSRRLRESILADEAMGRRLALWDRLDAALVGIGPPTLAMETGPAHIMAERGELEDAAGDVVSRYFDVAGEPVEFAREELLLGVSRAQLRRAGTVLAVAAGAVKATSIIGAARGRLIDVLVTDAATATATLQQLKTA